MTTHSMTEGPLLKNIVIYTIPIILTGFLQLLFNAADLMIVGQFCGELSVAAVGNSGSIINLLVNLFAGIAAGTSVATAHALGAQRQDDAHCIVHTAVPTALICGLFVLIAGLLFTDPLLRMMNTPESVFSLSSVYMKIYFAGAPFMMIYNFCAAILRAAGDTKTPLLFLTIAGVLNVVLNIFFVTALKMNVAGVALATTISQAIAAVLVMIVLTRRNDCCQLVLSEMHIYKPQLTKMIYIGLPAGLQSALFSISNILIQSCINPFGAVLMSGNAAAGNIEGFIYIILNGFMQSAMNFTGQNVGARQYDRVKRIFGICLGSMLGVGLVVCSTVYLLGPTLLSLYITDSPEAIEWGMIRLGCLCFAYCLCGMMEISTGVLRGMGTSLTPMLTSILGVCGIRIVWIYTVFQLPAYHTPQCLYFSYPFTWIVTFLAQFLAFAVLYHRQTAKEATVIQPR